jgi:hypothetical protein
MPFMGRLTLTDHGATRTVALSTSTLVGRHWSCGAVLAAPSVPLYWLEIRWLGERWGWRELTPRDQARGAGESLGDGWRALVGRVRWDERVFLDLADASAPEACAVDVATGAVARGDALYHLVEIDDEGAWRLGDDDAPRERLRDGDLFASGRTVWRLLLPEAPVATLRNGFHVGHPEVALDLDVTQLTATFTLHRTSAVARGECVRMLAPYAEARMEEPWDDGGWLHADRVLARWIALGGNPQSDPERAGWEKGRLRSQLAEQGVRGLVGLFERRRVAGRVETRLVVHPSRVRVVGG